MTARQAVLKTRKIWRAIAKDPRVYIGSGNCPLCEYDNDCYSVGDGVCGHCPLLTIRKTDCFDYACYGHFVRHWDDKDYTVARKHARAVVRVLDRLLRDIGRLKETG